eukprot:GILI01019970.1.p1 GENE.GILI01019970.1~~GILI01019970.1.p1  ORF type:complete len:267 (+),score=62.59 GILI01019970.1:70-801(+)
MFVEDSLLSSPVVFDGTTLLLSAVSCGGVGELVMDVLINSLQLSRVGFLKSPHFLPVSGHGSDGRLHINLEVYQGAGFTAVQVRAPLLYRASEPFVSSLVQGFLKQHSFSRVLCVGSLADYKRPPHLIGQDGFFYVSTVSGLAEFKDSIDSTSVAPLPEDPQSEALPKETSLIKQGGLSKPLYASFASDSTLPPLLLLFTFASEGNNTWLALNMAQMVAAFLKLENLSLRVPGEWDMSALGLP